ncbi:MAG: class I SAM-dependent methyltransferase [Verrucomicrobiota bacterium]
MADGCLPPAVSRGRLACLTMDCPCCNSTSWYERWPGFMICGQCGVMTVEQSFAADELHKLYGPEYFAGREYIDYVADKTVQQKTLAGHLRVVRRHEPPGGRLLEIGCAHGFFLELIQRDYPNPVGIDISEAAVGQARARGLDARAGDLLELPLDGSFDAACLWDTIEHLARPYEVITRAHELLKPGGHLFLTTGDFGSLLARMQGLRWRQIHPPTHLFYFTRQSLRALCSRVGLEVVEFRTVTVHRRFGSALQALARFHAATLSGRLASLALRALPTSLLAWGIPANLGDTMLLVARKNTSPPPP